MQRLTQTSAFFPLATTEPMSKHQQHLLPGSNDLGAPVRFVADQPSAATSTLVRLPEVDAPKSPWLVTKYHDAIRRLQCDNRVEVYTEAEARAELINLDWDSTEAFQLRNAVAIAWPGGKR